jgi:hypothetical protein
MGARAWSVVGVGLFGALACAPAGGDPSVAAPPGVDPSGAASAGMRPVDKVADIVVRTAAALIEEPQQRRGAVRPDARAHLTSNLVMHVGSGGLEVALHVPHELTELERATIVALGARVGEVATAPDGSSRVEAWVPASALMSLAELGFVSAVTPPGYGNVNQAITVQSEAVGTHRAALAHARGITGRGVVVGVTSNGTHLGNVDSQALAQARGELPATCPMTSGPTPACIFTGATPCVCNVNPGAGHEGTAMMELVHDIAPGADILFYASSGVAGHVNALNGLVVAGANVITEDLAFDGEPAFQRGLAATMADLIAVGGVPVHATAGNLANSHTARVLAVGTGMGPDGVTFTSTPPGCAYKPDNVVAIAPNGDTTFDAMWTGYGVGLVLQWSEPRAIFPTVGQGGFTDLNIYVMDEGLTRCLLQSTGVQANGRGDTIEYVGDAAAPMNAIPDGTHVKIVVDVQGSSTAVAPPMLDFRFRGIGPIDATTAAGSLDPDSNYTSNRVPNVGASNDGVHLNGFSGQGPETLGLTTVCPGNIPGPCTGVAGGGLRTLPGIFWVARDGISISGVGAFGGGTCPAPEAAPQGRCFFGGTSASAPHSAGCDALLRQVFGPSLSPLSSNGRLASTARGDLIDANTGQRAVATAQGVGLLDCYAALGPPHMSCATTTLSVDDTCHAAIDPAALAAGSFDPEGSTLMLTASPPGPLPPGDTLVEVTGTDADNLTASCPAVVHVVDAQAPQLGFVPLQLCTLARQPIVIEAPVASDNCPFTLSGTILADGTIPVPLAVMGGASVTLPVGTHRILWQANDGSQTATRTQTIVVADPPLRRLANGDMLFSATFASRQAYVEAFVQQNGVQNVAGNIVGTGVANPDGTFTYSRVVPANRYRQGDVVRVRFYSYQVGRAGVFTPGPAENVWFADAIYGQNPGCPAAEPPACETAKLTPINAVASSQEAAGLRAPRAIDGSFATRWSSAFSDPQWIYVDLGAPRFVSRVVLNWETAASARYELQVSNDAATWTTVFTETAGNGFTDDIPGLNVEARFVRVFSTARATRWGSSLWEFQVFGDNDPDCQ